MKIILIWRRIILLWIRSAHCFKIEPMTDYAKLEYIHFAIQEAMESLKGWRGYEDPELKQALEFVEDLREPYLSVTP